MGFDNECILNIQSLAGEYFCPVCRLLVYPNEALQSQCTHLYCKPCLTYVVSTTRACPYDGFLVTEADSKPLIESNKALAETIGKITVHCLYHRSGCTWQGPLSECTSHCSGCAFGNSPVVCNRCGIQIVHRQVQEHAQNCPGVQSQALTEATQDAATTGTTAAADQAQATTQAQTSQTTTSSLPVPDPSQQVNPTTQPQSVVQATVPTTEQWFQQQQQYQQYYQQYPGYDLYQQHYQQYYPYQQHAVPQYPQPQAYMQPQTPHPQLQSQLQGQPQAQLQTQHQSHPNIQLHAAAQTQSQPQVNPQQQTTGQPQSQIQSQTHPTPHGHPHPQAQLQPQAQSVQHHAQNLQIPQQPHTQMQHPQPPVQAQAHSLLHPQHPVPQPQPHSQGLQQTHSQHPVQSLAQHLTSQPNQPVNPHLQPQLQHSSANAVTGHHSYSQPQPQQQVQLGGPQHAVLMYPQGGPHPQNQHPIQMPGQVPNVPPAQQQPVQSHPHQPGLPVHQRPVLQSVQQQFHQQHSQQPFSGQALGPVQNQMPQQGTYLQQPLHMQSQLRPHGLPQSFPPSHAYPQSIPHGTPPYQAQNLGGRPMMPPYGVSTKPHPPAPVGMQARAMQGGLGQQSGNALRTNNQDQLASEQHTGATSRPMPERQGDQIIDKGSEAESTSHKNAKRDPYDLDVAAGIGADSGEVKTIKSESDLKPVNDDNKPMGEIKDISESLGAENGEKFINQVKKEPKEGTNDQKGVSNANRKQVEHFVSEDKETMGGPMLKTPPLQEGDHLEDQSMKSQDRNVTPQLSGGFPLHGQMQGENLLQPSHAVPIADQGKQEPSLTPHGHSTFQQRPVGSSSLQAPPPGPPRHTQLPGHPSAPLRPLGAGLTPNSGQPLNPPSEYFQQPLYQQSHGSDVSPTGDPGSTSVFGRGPSHYGPQGPYTQGERRPSYGHESDMFPNHTANFMDGRRLDPLGHQPGMPPNMMRMNGAPGLDSSSGLELRDDRFRPLPDPSRIVDRGEFEEDLKHFPRPPHLGTEKYGSHFPSSRALDRGPHSYGMDLPPKPLDNGPHGLNYDSVPPGGSAPPRFFPHRHDGMMHPNDLGEIPAGFQDNVVGRQPDGRNHPDIFGPPPRYGRRHMDGMAPRSPSRDYPGFGAFHGLDDIAGRESRRFGDSYHGNRFPVLPSHLRRSEFEGHGQDVFPKHFRRGEHLDPHELPSHIREPIGYGASRMGELTGPGNFFHPRLGEPGYRNSYSLKGIPGDGGNYTGDLESFDGSRRRKSSSMGWCRICKVDCETVEGLDLHSQTRDHQKMAMDVVLTIKKNAKKQKLAPSDHSSLDDTSKSRNASFEGRGGNKN
ncbi:AT-rich interactive domain-containing protein 1A isoform X2 [Jatropha curcas]|uniref:AT-rich interactive domain-containing protein 1A isoform X2 n=1 Tax=Jatropha curcas TaxID=180498 RepID=UPI0005FC1676|nr:AT-rich interactive domain-containing protein 1A isoform X2 [Jatropha curcas]